MKRPSFQFYPGDWMNDLGLRMCSSGARGLWADMLCLMHQGSTYGYLEVNLIPILPANLAKICGLTVDECNDYLRDLESNGVFTKDERGCILSRRMIRDENVRMARAAGGSLGGNPQLINNQKDNHKVGDKVNLHANLRPTPSSSSSSSSSSSIVDNSLRSLSRKQPRGTKQAPDDFEVTQKIRDWAKENASNADPDEEVGAFKDHTFTRSIVDWDGAFRNWLRKSHKDAGKRNGNHQMSFAEENRQRVLAAAPSIAAKPRQTPVQFFMEVEARDVTPKKLG